MPNDIVKTEQSLCPACNSRLYHYDNELKCQVCNQCGKKFNIVEHITDSNEPVVNDVSGDTDS